MKNIVLLIFGLSVLGMLSSCGELPPDYDAPNDKVSLVCFLEPGDSGMQKMHLTHTVSLGTPMSLENTYVPNAIITLVNHTTQDTVLATDNQLGFCYEFNRADFPMSGHDSVSVELSGHWSDFDFSGETGTLIVSPDNFDWIGTPPVDTVMVHDESLEANLTDVTAFYLHWEHLVNGIDYRYQLQFKSVVHDPLSDQWVETPLLRRFYLRSDEEEAWQWGPFPTLRTVPSEWTGEPHRVSWGAFVFVDSASDTTIDGHSRKRGHYDVELSRLNDDAMDFLFSTHMWIRQFDWDPIEFNIENDHCQGILASRTSISFRMQVVDGYNDVD